MKDLMNLITPKVAIAPQVATNADTAIVGEIVDRSGYESATLVISTGTLTDADATFAVSVEHGDDSGLSDTAAPATTELVGTLALAGFTFAADKACRKLGYIGSKQYLRATVTPTGNNSGAAPISAVWILGNPRATPTANPPA